MVKLGTKVKDALTGFEGIAIGRSEYLYGCHQVLIKPQELKDGKPIEGEWVDEQRVVYVDGGGVVFSPAAPSPVSSASSGGPQREAPPVR